MNQFTNFLNAPEYDFLRTDPNLGDNIILLGYGGSHAYGTNVPESDVDVRGIAQNRPSCILSMDSFEQREDPATDTVVYGLAKALNLLAGMNPNAIELLGLRKQDYFIVTETGQQLLDNKDMFFSKRAIHAFGGYATAQLRRLQNALAHDAYPDDVKQKHILSSIQNAMRTFADRYSDYHGINVRVDDEKGLVLDVQITGCPLKEAHAMISELYNVQRDYDKLNQRNRKKDDAHLNKHAMHLIRLLATGEELLRAGELHTYRDKEHDLLMSIRNGAYQKGDHMFTAEFFDLVDEYERKFRYAAENSVLPDNPDFKRINDFLMETNLKAIKMSV